MVLVDLDLTYDDDTTDRAAREARRAAEDDRAAVGLAGRTRRVSTSVPTLSLMLAKRFAPFRL